MAENSVKLGQFLRIAEVKMGLIQHLKSIYLYHIEKCSVLALHFLDFCYKGLGSSYRYPNQNVWECQSKLLQN